MKRALTYSLSCVYALVLLMGCARDGAQMREQLSALEQRNSSGEPMENDSLAEALVDYFDRHGSANERMRAKYILGRTYYCLGELPRALETYMEAADCADTTAADCDFAKLSRIHAQSAQIYRRQVQPRSQLSELIIAEYYGWKAKDTLMALECLQQRTIVYNLLHLPDSVILFAENSAQKFKEYNRKERYAQALGIAITPLVNSGEIKKAKDYIRIYEQQSGFFDSVGCIVDSRKIYHYTKGNYYLKINDYDSAEYNFRKLFNEGKSLNDLIAASKGLQKVFEKRNNTDSIAKYSNLSYELNDSAYSLSEMQNIQKMQASYNYEHNKLLAEQKSHEAERAYYIIAIITIMTLVILLIAGYTFSIYKRQREYELKQYRQDLINLEKTQTELQELRTIESQSATLLIEKKNAEILALQESVEHYRKLKERHVASLENRIDEAGITKHLHSLLNNNPPQLATQEDLRQLKLLINEEIPSFYSTLNTPECPLRAIEYEICLLIRCHFQPSEICKLLDRNESYVANIRKAILQKLYGVKGTPKDLDIRIMTIK